MFLAFKEIKGRVSAVNTSQTLCVYANEIEN